MNNLNKSYRQIGDDILNEDEGTEKIKSSEEEFVEIEKQAQQKVISMMDSGEIQGSDDEINNAMFTALQELYPLYADKYDPETFAEKVNAIDMGYAEPLRTSGKDFKPQAQ